MSGQSAADTERMSVVIEYVPDQKSKPSVLADIREALQGEAAGPRAIHSETNQEAER